MASLSRIALLALLLLALALLLAHCTSAHADNDDDDNVHHIHDDSDQDEEEEEDTRDAAENGLTTGIVHVLTGDSFHDVTRVGQWLIEFYAPWCGHCQRLQPVFEETARAASEVFFGKVDCDEHRAVCEEFGVSGYPTIKFKRGEVVLPYKGARTRDGFLQWLKRVNGPLLREVTADSVEAFATEDARSVSFLLINPSTETRRIVESVAQTLLFENKFGVVKEEDSKAVLEELRFKLPKKNRSGLLSITIGEGVDLLVESVLENAEAVRDWVYSRRLPLVAELNESTYEAISEDSRNTYLLIASSQLPGSLESARNLLTGPARADRSRLFAVIDFSKYERFIESTLTTSAAELPVIMRIDFKGSTFQKMPAASRGDNKLISEEQLHEFIRQAEAGDISSSSFGGGVFTGLWDAGKRFLIYIGQNPSVGVSIVLAYIAVMGLLVYVFRRMSSGDDKDDKPAVKDKDSDAEEEEEEEEEGEKKQADKRKPKESSAAAEGVSAVPEAKVRAKQSEAKQD